MAGALASAAPASAAGGKNVVIGANNLANAGSTQTTRLSGAMASSPLVSFSNQGIGTALEV